MKRKSQTERILNYLLKGKSITSMQAIKMFGCTRLASRIHEISQIVDKRITYLDNKNKPFHPYYEVEDSWVTRNGKRYKKYWLA